MTNAPIVPSEHIDSQSPPWSRTTRRVVALIFAVIFLILLWRFQGLLAQVTLAWVVAYLLHPVINAITTRFPRVHRIAATVIVYLLLIVILLAIIGMIGVAAFNQFSELSKVLPDRINEVVAFIGNLTNNPNATIVIGPWEIHFADIDWAQLQEQALANINPALATGGAAAGAVAGGAVNVLGWLSLTFIISLYIAVDLPRFARELDQIAMQSGYHADFTRIKTELLEIGNAYLRGQAILGLAVGTLTGVLLALLGVQNALALGIVSGLLELIPYFGPVISAVVAVLVALFQPENHLGLGQLQFALATLAVMILVQQIENNFLVPRVVGDALNLKPLTVMIAVIMGGALFGIMGIILAGPAAAAIKLLGGYLWRKTLGLPPFPPEKVDEKEEDRPSLLGQALARIRSRRSHEEIPQPGNPARSMEPPPPGEGEPPAAARQ